MISKYQSIPLVLPQRMITKGSTNVYLFIGILSGALISARAAKHDTIYDWDKCTAIGVGKGS
jgi:hypothetical protein